VFVDDVRFQRESRSQKHVCEAAFLQHMKCGTEAGQRESGQSDANVFNFLPVSVRNNAQRDIDRLALFHKYTGLFAVDAFQLQGLPATESSKLGVARFLPLQNMSMLDNRHWWMMAWTWADENCTVYYTTKGGLWDFINHPGRAVTGTALGLVPLGPTFNFIKSVGFAYHTTETRQGDFTQDTQMIRELLGSKITEVLNSDRHYTLYKRRQQTLGYSFCNLKIQDLQQGIEILIQDAPKAVVLKAQNGAVECVLAMDSQQDSTFLKDPVWLGKRCLQTEACLRSEECARAT